VRETISGGGGVHVLCERFWKWFMKNLDVNHFPKFCTKFSGQVKTFSV
jgi:hypothetical protein